MTGQTESLFGSALSAYHSGRRRGDRMGRVGVLKQEEEEEPRPLSRYEDRHGLTAVMRPLRGARRTRKYRWDKLQEGESDNAQT